MKKAQEFINPNIHKSGCIWLQKETSNYLIYIGSFTNVELRNIAEWQLNKNKEFYEVIVGKKEIEIETQVFLNTKNRKFNSLKECGEISFVKYDEKLNKIINEIFIPGAKRLIEDIDPILGGNISKIIDSSDLKNSKQDDFN